MPFNKLDTTKLANKYGVDVSIIKAKQEIIECIKAVRQKKGLSQQEFARKIGKSQSFVAKIESGIGTKNYSLDLLLKILTDLGCNFKITTSKGQNSKKMAA